MSSCKEDDYSETYDITLPVAELLSVSNTNPYVDEEITLTGENLNTVSSVMSGVYRFTIVSMSENGTSMVVKVPRVVDAGVITLTNKYKREFISTINVVPQFYPIVVTNWPSVIEKGKPVVLKGENMDLIKEVK